MTDVMTMAVDTEPVTKLNTPPAQADALDKQLVGQLVEQVRANGLQLTDEGGLLQRLTKLVVESALDGEITWVTTSTIPRGRTAATAVTAPVPRRY